MSASSGTPRITIEKPCPSTSSSAALLVVIEPHIRLRKQPPDQGAARAASIRQQKALREARRRLELHLREIIAHRRIEAEQPQAVLHQAKASALLRGAITRPMRKAISIIAQT